MNYIYNVQFKRKVKLSQFVLGRQGIVSAGVCILGAVFYPEKFIYIAGVVACYVYVSYKKTNLSFNKVFAIEEDKPALIIFSSLNKILKNILKSKELKLTILLFGLTFNQQSIFSIELATAVGESSDTVDKYINHSETESLDTMKYISAKVSASLQKEENMTLKSKINNVKMLNSEARTIKSKSHFLNGEINHAKPE